MRKLTKALVFVLLLSLTLIAFAIVSFAAEETTLEPISLNTYNNFEGYDEGKVFGGNRKAHGVLTVADNGNKYVTFQSNPNYTDTAGSRWDVNNGTGCTIIDYPYVMFEFDVMTVSGNYDGTGLYFRLYGKNAEGTNKNALVGSQVYFSNISLSTVPYEWNHVSLIQKYNGNDTFTRYTFVNGVQVGDGVNADFSSNEIFTAGNQATVSVKEFLMYPSESSKIGLDNFLFTYFPAGYLGDDLNAMANYTYKSGENYEFPYRKTVATLTDNETGEVAYYDDLYKALEDKNENNTFTQLCDAELIYPSGGSHFFTADEFATTFKAAPKGSTIKLHNDITLNAALGFSYEHKLTLDLNGYNLYRMGSEYTDYAAVYNEETGEYEKGEALESPAPISAGAMFVIDANLINFTVTSSRPGGSLYSISIKAERLLLDGKVVATNLTSTASDKDQLFVTNHSNAVILLKDVNTYANSIVYAEHGSGFNLSFNIDGGTHVKIVSSTMGMFHLLRGGNHTIKNATLVGNNGYVARAYGYSTYATINFENCDILSAHNEAQTGETIIFKNCRLNSHFNTITGTVRFEGVNRFNNKYDAFTYGGEGLQVVSAYKTGTYVYPTKLAFDPITLLPTPADTEERTATFSYLVYNPETDVVNVTWKDFDGKVIKTEELIRTEKAETPLCYLPAIDGWRSPVVTEWLDSEGNAASLILEKDEVYTAVRPVIDENTKYMANVSEAYLSFSYVAQFHMYFYLPVTEGMERPTLTDKAPSSSSGTVLIGGQKYWVYTWWCAAPTVADDTTFVINFEIDGVKYTQKFTINALMYAEIVLSNPTSDEEAFAVANMVRYVKESRIACGRTVGEKFDKLIGSEGLYPNLPAYPETYPDDSLDTSAIAPYVDVLTLSISTTPCYRVSLSQKAIDLGMTKDNYRLTTKSGVRLDLYDYVKNGKDFDTNNTKIYNLVETFTITVTVPAVKDAETGEVITESFTVSCDYSIGTYIKSASEQHPEANLDLARASYAFALAAKAYRDSVINY